MRISHEKLQLNYCTTSAIILDFYEIKVRILTLSPQFTENIEDLLGANIGVKMSAHHEHRDGDEGTPCVTIQIITAPKDQHAVKPICTVHGGLIL